jgi:hypothetical protein
VIVAVAVVAVVVAVVVVAVVVAAAAAADSAEPATPRFRSEDEKSLVEIGLQSFQAERYSRLLLLLAMYKDSQEKYLKR